MGDWIDQEHAHPETYTLTRDEWLKITRVLSDAALTLLNRSSDRGTVRERFGRVRDAQDILSNAYDAARLATGM